MTWPPAFCCSATLDAYSRLRRRTINPSRSNNRSVLLLIALEALGLGKQRHAAHQVLEGHDPDEALVLHHRNKLLAGDFAEDVGQWLMPVRHLVCAVHGRLDIAVTIGAQRTRDDLPRNRADHIRAADHGEIILQRVKSFA